MAYSREIDEQVVGCPTTEVATWLEKINRFELAKGLAKNFFMEGKDSEGHTAWTITASTTVVPDEQLQPLYDEGIMYELGSNEFGLNSIARATRAHLNDGEGSAVNAVRGILLQEGYLRLGILEEGATSVDELVAPIGALAAAHVRRGSIREATDRRLYDRIEDIETAQVSIRHAAKPRLVSDGQPLPLYSAIARGMPLEQMDVFTGGEATVSPRELWWRELKNDFARIEAAGAALKVA